jgi:hypothetical protein
VYCPLIERTPVYAFCFEGTLKGVFGIKRVNIPFVRLVLTTGF